MRICRTGWAVRLTLTNGYTNDFKKMSQSVTIVTYSKYSILANLRQQLPIQEKSILVVDNYCTVFNIQNC